MRILGIVLIVLGAAGLILGGVDYTKRRQVVNVGPLSASVDEKERVAIPPLLSGATLAAGIVILLVGARRR